jgi:15-cis-phytoene synthase
VRTSPTSLDPAFVARAIPVGSARHWSYVFAPPLVRGPLLGVYALLAEWLALLDPATERTVAQIKLAWWQEEMSRLTAGKAVHPISRHLASQPGAAAVHFAVLTQAVEAAMIELGGVPLELGLQLQPHSAALLAGPLRIASLLGDRQPDPAGLDKEALDRCTRALAVAQYLARALRDYRRDAGIGRVPFAVDELLRAGVENGDLLMLQAPPRLQAYLGGLQQKADTCYADAAQQLPAAARVDLRHLLVLAALGRKQLHAQDGTSAFAALKDMLLAWTTARRAGH